MKTSTIPYTFAFGNNLVINTEAFKAKIKLLSAFINYRCDLGSLRQPARGPTGSLTKKKKEAKNHGEAQPQDSHPKKRTDD